MWLSGWGWLGRRCWAFGVPARYPSTEESGKWTLLCETSLTRCPPSLRTQWPRLSPGSRSSTPHLERANQVNYPSRPTNPARPISNHTDALAWVTNSRYWVRQMDVYTTDILKTSFLVFLFDVGRPRELLTHRESQKGVWYAAFLELCLQDRK